MLRELDNDTIHLLTPNKSESELEELFAMKAVSVNPGLLDNAFVFEKLCYALNHIKPNVEYFEPASILQIAKCISKLPKHNWNNEIKQYIAHVAHSEGWVTLPDILLFAQEELNDISSFVELNEEQKKVQELKHLAIDRYLLL